MDRNTAAETAQIARINRKLAKENRKLCTSRSNGQRSNLGRFHVIDTWNNTVVDWHVNLDAYERDLGSRA
jgi:hypothetical protein